MILSCVSISGDSDWTASRGVIYAVYVGLILFHGLSAAVLGRVMPKIQTACIYINIGLIVATVIALPVGKVARGGSLNSGKYVFSQVENETGWPTGCGLHACLARSNLVYWFLRFLCAHERGSYACC